MGTAILDIREQTRAVIAKTSVAFSSTLAAISTTSSR